jgi:hypothetical protein
MVMIALYMTSVFVGNDINCDESSPQNMHRASLNYALEKDGVKINLDECAKTNLEGDWYSADRTSGGSARCRHTFERRPFLRSPNPHLQGILAKDIDWVVAFSSNVLLIDNYHRTKSELFISIMSANCCRSHVLTILNISFGVRFPFGLDSDCGVRHG